jgi:hypothetical protein
MSDLSVLCSSLQDSLKYLKVAVAAQISLASPVRFQQSLRFGRSERVGSNKTLDSRRWVEHGIEHDKVHCSGFLDFQSNNGHRMACMLEIYWRFAGHHDFVFQIEDSVVAEVFADGKNECFVTH